MLRRLRRELAAIADLQEQYVTGVAADSAMKVLIEPVQTVGRLVLEPKDTLVGEYGPADLRMLNRRRLKGMGVREALRREFLDHPFYSARHQTIIVSCLEALSKAKRRDRFLAVALNASSEDEALFYQQAAEMLPAYNEQVMPIAEIIILERIALGRSKERSLFFPAPVDGAIWMQKTEALFDRLSNTRRQRKDRLRVDLWVTGRVSHRARQELLNRGIVARENMAQELALAD